MSATDIKKFKMKRMKGLNRILAFVLCFSMVIAGTAVSFADEAAADWKDKEYTAAVEDLMSEGIITGDVDGLFHPDDNLTRAQACKIVIATIGTGEELLTSSAALSAGRFTDLSGAKWAAPYIGYAAAAGIIQGYEDGSFRPSNKVTVAELCAMLVRASGADDTVSGTWPANYVNAADALGLFSGTGMVDENGNHPTNLAAAKWMAAQLTYNGKSGIKENAAVMNEAVEKALAPETGEVENPEEVDIVTQDVDMGSYGKVKDAVYCPGGKLSADFSQLLVGDLSSGVALSKDVKVYTYGLSKDYNKKMKLESGAAFYRPAELFKYKGVLTKAWCGVKGDEINVIILPSDVGFSGNVYAVINEIVTVQNSDGMAVTALETLVAGHETHWAAKNESVTMPGIAEINAAFAEGAIFEIAVTSGEVTHVTSDPAMKRGKEFKVLTGGTWATVSAIVDRNNEIGVDSRIYEVNPDASVYVLASDGSSYEAGSLKSIRKGDMVRLYDIRKDDEDIADIIVVKKD